MMSIIMPMEPVHFLLVDDLDENLLSLEALLRREGLVLLKAKSGPEALELLLKHEVALALLDVQMPGMDGFELAELMRGNVRTKHVPIIFLTAGSADRLRRFRGYEAGAVDFLHKPIEPDILRSKADVFFDLFQQRQQAARLLEESRRHAAAVDEARAHLQLMVESAQDYAIISLDAKGRVTSWSSGAQRIFGYSPERMLGNTRDFLFTPEDQAQGIPAEELRIAAEKGRVDNERWLVRENGEHFYSSGTIAAMRNDAGTLTGFIKIARDMTKERRAQEALVEARNAAEAANVAKSEFLANMSHEIRTPMNAVVGLAHILDLSEPLTPKQREFIKTLKMSADSLLSLINDLLDIAKVEAGTVELEHVPFSVVKVAEEAVRIMKVRAQEKQLALTLNLRCACIETRHFYGDPARVRQILLNLCGNAIKFTEKGEVHLDLLCEPMADGRELVKIAVHDTGIGIPPDKMGTIFDKFVQADSSINRKYGGTGLGLAICKTLAEVMGGSITVDSILRRGSVFTLTLPLKVTQPAVEAIEQREPKEQAHDNKPRVLLVEDYPANVMVATTFLEEFGYTVDVASNGAEACEAAKRGEYVAALMDVQMHGMNGFEATAAIRSYEKEHGRARLPIIGMTAHALAGDRERCLASGMDDYIAKPFNPDELEQKLARYQHALRQAG